MHSNHIIPPENENRWTAFLNGEAGIPDFPNAGEIENADLTSVWESMGTHFSYTSSNPDRAWLQLQNEITKLDKKTQNQATQLSDSSGCSDACHGSRNWFCGLSIDENS